ncbi:hypothetical protein [Thermopirellula anaerolimosa]
MLPYSIVELSLRATTAGKLIAWIGPALRGLTAGRLKVMTCRVLDADGNPPAYCRGCRHHDECPYGRLYEPLAREDESEAFRPLVLSPYYPAPDRVEPGDEIRVRMLLLGDRACRDGPAVIGALADVGRKPGLGPDGIRFIAQQLAFSEGRLAPEDLPTHARQWPGVYPRVVIGLNTPLILRRRDADGRRNTVSHPSLGDLFTAAKIVLCRAFAQEGRPLQADLDDLQAAADRVECREDYYQTFRQIKWSGRTRQRFEVQGCVGGAAYKNVPASLIPWLYWAGLFHAAGHRVAGGGGWRVILD